MNNQVRNHLINKIDNQFIKNRLTFSDNGYKAHYLARTSYGANSEKQIKMNADSARNNRKYNAGFTDDYFLFLNGAVLSNLKIPKILSSMMDKAYKNLSKNNSDTEIAKMLEFTSNEVYRYNTDEDYPLPSSTAPYEDFVNGVKNGVDIKKSKGYVSNSIATIQSLLSLGLSKENYFTEIVKTIIDNGTTIPVWHNKKAANDSKKYVLSRIVKYVPNAITPLLNNDKDMDKIVNQFC